MRISLYTQILPRLEVFFLEEWIEHHLMIGVDKIYLYNNGFLSVDIKHGTGKTWAKKPYANYFLEYSDEEIMNKLQIIAASFGNSVSLVSWASESESDPNRALCQYTGYVHCVKNNQSDWWVHIDPDEYILSKKYFDLGEFISEQDTNKYSAFVMSQKVFEERKSGVSVRSMTRCYPRPSARAQKKPGHTKTIICNDIKKFNIHRPAPRHGLVKLVARADLGYNHYRGVLGEISNREQFDKEMNAKLKSIDDSMIKFLKKHGRELYT